MAQALLFLATLYAAFLVTGVSGLPLSRVLASEPPEPDRNNCTDKCGDVHIPYPFGIGPRCSRAHPFELTCDETTSRPSLFLGNLPVANITLETAQMVVNTNLTYSCSQLVNGRCRWSTQRVRTWFKPPYLFSPTENVFTSIGCNSVARIKGQGNSDYLTGCITSCSSVNDTEDGTPCAGLGCCEAPITPRLRNISVHWNPNKNCSNLVPDNPCQYAFVSTKGWYNFSRNDLIGNMTFADRVGRGAVVPVVIDWAIEDGKCPPAPEGNDNETVPHGACLSTHSDCVNASNRETGYFCKCSKGYTIRAIHT